MRCDWFIACRHFHTVSMPCVGFYSHTISCLDLRLHKIVTTYSHSQQATHLYSLLEHNTWLALAGNTNRSTEEFSTANSPFSHLLEKSCTKSAYNASTSVASENQA